MKKIISIIIIVIIIILMVSIVVLYNKIYKTKCELTIKESDILLSDDSVLPIGTVVLLKSGKKKIMITGHLQVTLSNKDLVYDYSAVGYPEGQLNTESSYLFNKEQIERIYFLGYKNEEQEELEKRINYLKKH